MEGKIDSLYKNISALPTKSDICGLMNELFAEFKEREDRIIEQFKEREERIIDDLKRRDEKIQKLEEIVFKKSPDSFSLPPSLSSIASVASEIPNSDIQNDEVTSLNIQNKCDSASAAVPVRPCIDDRKRIDVLLIGDSIIRHINVNKLVSGSCMKVCLPGARVDRVLSAVDELNQEFIFTRIVVHIGTNYIPHKSRRYIRRELIRCIDVLRNLMPNTHVILSDILPRTSERFMSGIHEINSWIREYCLDNQCGHMDHSFFGKSFNTDRNSIRGDGVHLNFFGVKQLQDSMERYFRGR